MTWLAEFLDMGGYAGFVWPSFIVTAVVLAGLLAVSLKEWRSTDEILQGLRRERRRGAGTATEDEAG